MLPKKYSYFLLILFFTFDALVSYWAITQMGGHEADLLIAPFVEKYPLLYFICLLLEILSLFFVGKVFKKIKLQESTEQFILTACVIFWASGNSSMNFVYTLGFRGTLFNNWSFTAVTGIVVTLFYLCLTFYKLKK